MDVKLKDSLFDSQLLVPKIVRESNSQLSSPKNCQTPNDSPSLNKPLNQILKIGSQPWDEVGEFSTKRDFSCTFFFNLFLIFPYFLILYVHINIRRKFGC